MGCAELSHGWECFGSLSALPVSCHPSGCLENLGGFAVRHGSSLINKASLPVQQTTRGCFHNRNGRDKMDGRGQGRWLCWG